MFVDLETARRIERAEAAAMQATVAPLRGAFAHELSPGIATYARPDSPFNKVLALEAELGLDAVEQAYLARAEPVRIELCTLAAPALLERLAERGYRLLGFENVLGRKLAAPVAPGPLRITQPGAAEFLRVDLEATLHPDDSGVVLDQFGAQTITSAIEDSLAQPGLLYLAHVADEPAGAGSMRLHDGVAIFSGAATLPRFRRRGVQSALIAHRLAEAYARGAELAVVTTSPGTQSMANMMKHGFALLYARAVLVLNQGTGV